MSVQLLYNGKESRYEMAEAGHVVYANVRRNGGTLYIDYVFAPPELRGTGAAGRFMEGLMAAVRAEGLKVIPICGYAATWLKRHPEYKDAVNR